jgi:hypothetical protein
LAALALGLPSALISAYWGSGGEWLLDTVGGTIEEEGRAGNPALIAAVWAAVALKLVAAFVGLASVNRWLPRRNRFIRLTGWAAAAILTLYGLVLTVAGVLVEAGVISAAPDADRHALRWHAFFWDPWFLLWGACLAAAMTLSRTKR